MATATMVEMTTVNERAAWRAVEQRDASWDGRVYYGVTTTGVYCRPSCPSRRPSRGNVQFFAEPGDARAAGFRACLRCRPDGVTRVAEQVAQAKRLLDAHVDGGDEERMTLDHLARAVGMSAYHLQRVFKAQVGLSPSEYARARRSERLKAELRSGETVSRATYGAGFGSGSRAYDAAASHLGMTPGAYRRGGRGVAIQYTIVETTYGLLLVAATARGVSMIALGDDRDSLLGELRAEFAEAELVAADRARSSDDATFAGWVEAIVAQLDADGTSSSVPVDAQGTAFQWRVWRALQAIPRGETRSYAEVANAIGAPTSARAVAQACATNPVALVVPCHRVVRATGELSGYRWGVERKRRLLDAERR